MYDLFLIAFYFGQSSVQRIFFYSFFSGELYLHVFTMEKCVLLGLRRVAAPLQRA